MTETFICMLTSALCAVTITDANKVWIFLWPLHILEPRLPYFIHTRPLSETVKFNLMWITAFWNVTRYILLKETLSVPQKPAVWISKLSPHSLTWELWMPTIQLDSITKPTFYNWDKSVGIAPRITLQEVGDTFYQKIIRFTQTVRYKPQYVVFTTDFWKLSYSRNM